MRDSTVSTIHSRNRVVQEVSGARGGSSVETTQNSRAPRPDFAQRGTGAASPHSHDCVASQSEPPGAPLAGSPTAQTASLSPQVAHPHESSVFLRRPLVAANVRVQMIVPPAWPATSENVEGSFEAQILVAVESAPGPLTSRGTASRCARAAPRQSSTSTWARAPPQAAQFCHLPAGRGRARLSLGRQPKRGTDQMTRLLGPGPLDELGVQHFLPSVQALHVCPPLEELGCGSEVGGEPHSDGSRLHAWSDAKSRPRAVFTFICSPSRSPWGSIQALLRGREAHGDAPIFFQFFPL